MASNGDDRVLYGEPTKIASFDADGDLWVHASKIPKARVEKFINWLIAHRPLPEVEEGKG